MTASLCHRGPDEEGVHLGAGVSLGHRRLSVIDLTGGRQPMAGADGLVVLVYNGELYNFKSIRNELQQDFTFRTRSDTEVVLNAYLKWGRDFLHRLNGMFALALSDARTGTVLLGRDRMGEKPLYYTFDRDNHLYFASEPKALFQHPALSKKMSATGLAAYLQHEYLPAPLSIYENVSKLDGGHFLEYNLATGKHVLATYWQPDFAEIEPGDDTQAANRLTGLLENSVRERLVADVPVGIFLSGGLDSSTIAALACRLRPAHTVQTFSIGFADSSFDESAHARFVAERLGTHHHQEILSPGALLEILPEILARLDEPLGDASLVPTYLLCRFARQHVTVALGGDGADELFAGYPTFQAEKTLRHLRPPAWFCKMFANAAGLLPVNDDNFSFDFKIKQTVKGLPHKGDTRLNAWMGSFDSEERNRLLVDPSSSTASQAMTNIFAYYQKKYLQEDILVKTDRASMMNSLEVRAPFLDNEVVALANSLPERFKLRRATTKYILKRSAAGLLPSSIIDRPKKGFGIPVAKWFKNELRRDLEDTLSRDKLADQGIFHYPFVRQLLDGHFSNRFDARKQLWTLYIFQKWFDKEFSS